MFQNLLVAPLGHTKEVQHWYSRSFRTVWPEPSSHRKQRTDPAITKTIKRKLKRNRTVFTTEQLRGLEASFAQCSYIRREGRSKLSENLMLEDKAIKIWFQNRRTREKRKLNRSIHSCSSATGISASDLLHSPLSQIEFPHYNTEDSEPFPTEMPLTEMSTGYFVNTDYGNNFQKQFQEPNNISYYSNGYYNVESEGCYNVPNSFSVSGREFYVHDGTMYPAHCYQNENYFEGCTQTNMYPNNYIPL